MNDQLSSEIVSRNPKFASARKLTSGLCRKALERQNVVRCGLLLALIVGMFAVPCAGQIRSWSRGILELPITYDDCKGRARRALEAEGYTIQAQGGDLMGDYHIGGSKNVHSAVIACNSSPNNKTWANVFVASGNPDGNVPGAERVSLQRRLAQSSSGAGNDQFTTWTWAYGQPGQPVEVHGAVKFWANGRSEYGDLVGTWSRTGNQITIDWQNDRVDTLYLSPDGRVMTGTNKLGWNVRGTRQ